MFHGTKTTIPCTNPSQDKKGRRSISETIPKVGAPRLLTNCVKVCLLQDRFHLLEILKRRKSFLKPRRFFQILHIFYPLTPSLSHHGERGRVSVVVLGDGSPNPPHQETPLSMPLEW